MFSIQATSGKDSMPLMGSENEEEWVIGWYFMIGPHFYLSMSTANLATLQVFTASACAYA